MGIGLKIAEFLGIKRMQKKAATVNSYSWVGGFPVYNTADAVGNINNGYVGSEDVYSIVRRITRTVNMIPIKVYKVVDEEAFKKYQFENEKKNFSPSALVRKQFLRSKALEEVPDTHPLQKLIDNPNPTYSQTEFREGFHTFLLVTGNSYVYEPRLEFGVNAGKPYELWLCPSQYMSLQVSDTWPRRTIGYRLQIAEMINFKPEEISHTRYFNPQYNYVGNELIGLSPLTAGSKAVDRADAETDYSVNAFQNSGISGIVWNKSVNSDEVNPETLGKLKSDFYNEASGVTNARKLLFQAGEIGYTEIGLSPVDMNILESQKLTFKKLCNLYGVSDMLFNNDGIGNGMGGKTNIVYKDLYTNAALPAVYLELDMYNRSVVPAFNTGKEKFYVDCDISGINELQDDFKELASVYSTLPIFNPMMIAKAFNWDTDDVKDEWYIKNGYTSINDLMAGTIEPLPIDTENGD